MGKENTDKAKITLEICPMLKGKFIQKWKTFFCGTQKVNESWPKVYFWLNHFFNVFHKAALTHYRLQNAIKKKPFSTKDCWSGFFKAHICPIENLWWELKVKVHAWKLYKLHEMEQFAIIELVKIPQETCTNLVRSYSKRMQSAVSQTVTMKMVRGLILLDLSFMSLFLWII